MFRDQVLTDEQQMAFSRRLGPLEVTLQSIGQERRLHENLVDLSNLDPITTIASWTGTIAHDRDELAAAPCARASARRICSISASRPTKRVSPRAAATCSRLRRARWLP